ncbi:50S ribosomal protein L29 [bacterium]|nr:50S ribosomal protein L29 [Candidatus Omnitrophota bacterium]MBU2528197.1 50S ribosomal protein L29 [bacterium]MBU3929575.1 50S ribosomal protein L29 [bacterium]MBU4123322.1 50S ribosomal protein L29 [bacterium]MDO9513011.1 50S ribosomal protein L29 [Elusimicrobiota bacterium]
MAKKIKFAELSVSELEDKLRDYGKELVLMRMKKKQRALKDISQIGKVKKNIARVSTYLTAQKLKASRSGGQNA